jgi:protein-disulfide isomerase
MDKRFWGVIAAIALIFVGIIVVNSKSAKAPDASKSAAQATNHVKGQNAKNVTLVEYGDFQCPVCGLYEPTVAQVFEKYKADISFQFRNFPLQQIHQNAFAGSRAAEAAGIQNKYWEMHDLLYGNQNAWSASSNPLAIYEQYAQSLGLNVAQFKTDFASNKVNDAINADIREANKLNVSGTPTFYLNGKLVELSKLTGPNNSPTVEKFSEVIDAAIAKQKN